MDFLVKWSREKAHAISVSALISGSLRCTGLLTLLESQNHPEVIKTLIIGSHQGVSVSGFEVGLRLCISAYICIKNYTLKILAIEPPEIVQKKKEMATFAL